MAENPTSGRGFLFWLAVLGGVAVALFLIAKFLFPQLIKEFTAFIAGLFVVVTGLVFRKKKK